ncbi:hypothetical protein KDL29_08190 [bacterium]|nr:hypothetical protein [bacterium]
MISARGSAGGRWLMGLTTLAVVLALAGSMRLVPDLRSRAREAETKQNLQTIQLALERYEVDYVTGTYPLWLSGGAVSGTLSEAGSSRLKLDPLLEDGYFTKYPPNPFTVQDSRQRELIALAQSLTNDQLSPESSSAAVAPAYRFGSEHDLMGNVLANARMAKQYCGEDSKGQPVMRRTGADTFFFCVNQPTQSPSRRMLQGQFGYFPIDSHELVEVSVTPDSGYYLPLGYSLIGWGSVRHKGQDILSNASLQYCTDANGAAMLAWQRMESPLAANEEFDALAAVASNVDLTELIYIPAKNTWDGIPDGVLISLGNGTHCGIQSEYRQSRSLESAPEQMGNSNGS